jgi:hypothetical protein
VKRRQLRLTVGPSLAPFASRRIVHEVSGVSPMFEESWGVRGAAGVAGLLAFAVGCGSPDRPEDEGRTQNVTESVSANGGSTVPVNREDNFLVGAFPEVMLAALSGGCTGTVIGPYTVLTAKHCTDNLDLPNAYVAWHGVFPELSISKVYLNPYVFPAYTPSWWVTLNQNQQAEGGRMDDWPAQHDQAILFVPGLTPQYIRDNRLTPAAVYPPNRATTSNFTVVGVASTGGPFRDYYPTRFLPATPNEIRQHATSSRDGYFTRDEHTANFGIAGNGDSGGPTEWVESFPWPGGAPYVTQRVVTAVTHTAVASAPMGYDPGLGMTANQTLTANINSMWAQARMLDADGDGLPAGCDTFPTLENTEDLCPPAIGGPRGTATRDVPIGQIECKPGYAPVGMKGRYGALIDQLALKCRALSCIANPSAPCGDEYWTEAFGGEGGAAFSNECPAGHVMRSTFGFADQNLIFALGYGCRTLAGLNSGTGSALVSSVGNVNGGVAFARNCALGKALTGFQARTSDKRYVTGLQPICTSETSGYRTYAGGTGGLGAALKCPYGHVAVGTVQHNEGQSINAFGVLCGPRNLVTAGTPLNSTHLQVAHGGFMHFGLGVQAYAVVEPLSEAHLPSSYVTAQCPTGHAVNGVFGNATSLLNSVTAVRCRDIRPNQSAVVTLFPMVGSIVGNEIAQTCDSGHVVDGLYTRYGWMTDGLAMHCRAL